MHKICKIRHPFWIAWYKRHWVGIVMYKRSLVPPIYTFNLNQIVHNPNKIRSFVPQETPCQNERIVFTILSKDLQGVTEGREPQWSTKVLPSTASGSANRVAPATLLLTLSSTLSKRKFLALTRSTTVSVAH